MPLWESNIFCTSVRKLCRRLLCSLSETALQDVRVIIFDVRGGGQALRSMVNRRTTRHRVLALLVYMGVPVTPAPNPFNRPSPGHSYHILRLIDPYQPRLQVDLLIRDTDLYLVAFRRSLDGNWGIWYRFSDQQVPSFIVALDLGFTSNYSRDPRSIPTVGGPEDMVFIFNTLARHEDRLRLIPAVQRTLHIATVRRAVQNAAVVFCEVMRFIAVLLEMVRRLEAGEAASVLPGEMWNMITSWHVDCPPPRFPRPGAERSAGHFLGVPKVSLHALPYFAELVNCRTGS